MLLIYEITKFSGVFITISLEFPYINTMIFPDYISKLYGRMLLMDGPINIFAMF
jgi:hypothetical protein